MLSILQLSDLHLLAKAEDKIVGINTDHYFQACLEQAMHSAHFDLILLTGDLAQEPCAASYQRILNRLESYQIPCICLPGNHDDLELMQQVLNSQWVSCRKQTVLDNWRLICLNSQIPGKEGGYLTSDELQFLQDVLVKNPDCHALIAIHHHCLPTNSPWMDGMIIENNQALWAIADKYPQVKAITTGHIHQVMDIKAGHVRVLGTPSTCYQFTPESSEFSIDNMAPGYRIIELYSDGRIETEVKRLDEPLVGLALECHGYTI